MVLHYFTGFGMHAKCACNSVKY